MRDLKKMIKDRNGQSKFNIGLIIVVLYSAVTIAGVVYMYLLYPQIVADAQENVRQGVEEYFNKHGEMEKKVALQLVALAAERDFEYFFYSVLLGLVLLDTLALIYLTATTRRKPETVLPS